MSFLAEIWQFLTSRLEAKASSAAHAGRIHSLWLVSNI
jgi:hypothetical protein